MNRLSTQVERLRQRDDENAQLILALGDRLKRAEAKANRNPTIKEYLARIGRKGGGAGKGAAKRRGDSAYYKALRAKVKTYPHTLPDGRVVNVTVPESEPHD